MYCHLVALKKACASSIVPRACRGNPVKYSTGNDNVPGVLTTAQKTSDSHEKHDASQSNKAEIAQGITKYAMGIGEYPSKMVKEFQDTIEEESIKKELLLMESEKLKTKEALQPMFDDAIAPQYVVQVLKDRDADRYAKFTHFSHENYYTSSHEQTMPATDTNDMPVGELNNNNVPQNMFSKKSWKEILQASLNNHLASKTNPRIQTASVEALTQKPLIQDDKDSKETSTPQKPVIDIENSCEGTSTTKKTVLDIESVTGDISTPQRSVFKDNNVVDESNSPTPLLKTTNISVGASTVETSIQSQKVSISPSLSQNKTKDNELLEKDKIITADKIISSKPGAEETVRVTDKKIEVFSGVPESATVTKAEIKANLPTEMEPNLKTKDQNPILHTLNDTKNFLIQAKLKIDNFFRVDKIITTNKEVTPKPGVGETVQVNFNKTKTLPGVTESATFTEVETKTTDKEPNLQAKNHNPTLDTSNDTKSFLIQAKLKKDETLEVDKIITTNKKITEPSVDETVQVNNNKIKTLPGVTESANVTKVTDKEPNLKAKDQEPILDTTNDTKTFLSQAKLKDDEILEVNNPKVPESTNVTKAETLATVKEPNLKAKDQNPILDTLNDTKSFLNQVKLKIDKFFGVYKIINTNKEINSEPSVGETVQVNYSKTKTLPGVMESATVAKAETKATHEEPNLKAKDQEPILDITNDTKTILGQEKLEEHEIREVNNLISTYKTIVIEPSVEETVQVNHNQTKTFPEVSVSATVTKAETKSNLATDKEPDLKANDQKPILDTLNDTKTFLTQAKLKEDDILEVDKKITINKNDTLEPFIEDTKQVPEKRLR